MDKDKIILKNMFFSLLIKGGGLCISLLLLPIYLKFFNNNEVLGVWFSIISIVSWILTFDFGFGNGLRNYYVKYTIENNDLKKKKLISTTYIASLILSLFFSLICIVIIYYVNWNGFFNISEESIDSGSFKIVMMISSLSILLQFVFKTIISILQAEQKPAAANLLGLISNAILLVAIPFISSRSDVENLKIFSLIYLMASNIPLIFATVYLFGNKLSPYRPSFRFFDKSYLKNIFKLGMGFFWLQIVAMALFNSNNLLITWFTNSGDVVYYQTYYKLFSLVGSFAWIALVPIWSAVTEAYEQKNFIWMQKVYKKLMVVLLVAIFITFLLILLMQPLTNFWLGTNSFTINYKYSILFGIYIILYVWWGIEASFSNGTGKIKIQLIFATFSAVINIPLAYFFVQLMNGWVGVIIANIISMLFYCVAETIHMKKILGRPM